MEQKTTNTSAKATDSSRILSKSRIFFGILFIIISVVLLLSFVSYFMNWRADQSQAGTMLDKTIHSSNLFGKVGDWLGNIFIFESIGFAAFIVAFLFFMFGTLILKTKYFKPWKTVGHSLFFICWLPIFLGAVTKGQGVWSGVYGYQIMDFLNSVIGSVGLWLIILASIALYFILEFNLRPSAVKARLEDLNEKTVGRVRSMMPNSADKFEADEQLEEMLDDGNEIPKEPAKHPVFVPTGEKISVEEPVNVPKGFPEVPVTASLDTITTPNKTTFNDNFADETAGGNFISLDPSVSKAAQAKPAGDNFAFNVEVAAEKDDFDDHDSKSRDLVEKHGLYDHKLDLANFQMPTIDLLKDYGSEEISINKEELEENKNRIVGLLKNFNVGIAEIKATIGPTVTLYEIVPEAGIRVAAIKKLQDDIALNLSALGIRIIAPMPGKGTIGIEVPRKNPTMVSMRSVIASQKFQNSDMELPVVFGKTISNEIFMADLAKMPHLLMAGATGQGKSVGINAILTSLLYKKHPSEI